MKKKTKPVDNRIYCTTVIEGVPSWATNFLQAKPGVRKNLEFYNSIQRRSFSLESFAHDKDGNIYYSREVRQVKRSKNSYYLAGAKGKKIGLSLKNKKLSLWYGASLVEFPKDEILRLTRNEWAVNICSAMQSYITNSGFEKILLKKITNPVDLIKYYLKVNRIQASPRLTYNAITKAGLHKNTLLRAVFCAVNADHAIEFASTVGLEDDNDLIHQASILNRKIDFRWSKKRMEEVHQDWTKEIMEAEVAELEDVYVEYCNIQFRERFPDGIRLLNTKKFVFAEGKEMSHCIYTNYWADIEEQKYLAFAIEKDGIRCTLGCRVYYETDESLQKTVPIISFDQVNTRHNKGVGSEMRAYCKELIENNFLFTNHKSKQNERKHQEVEVDPIW